jgi:hypothetical protein
MTALSNLFLRPEGGGGRRQIKLSPFFALLLLHFVFVFVIFRRRPKLVSFLLLSFIFSLDLSLSFSTISLYDSPLPVAVFDAWNDLDAFSLLEGRLQPLSVGEGELEKRK